jgi:hypothetical protein
MSRGHRDGSKLLEVAIAPLVCISLDSASSWNFNLTLRRFSAHDYILFSITVPEMLLQFQYFTVKF